jgi:hypothetical protein
MRRLHFFACSLVLGLTACGGGGGGGSVTGSGGGGGSRSPIPPQTALTYSGSQTGAAVTATSAGTIASNVIGSTGGGLGGSLLAGVAVQVASTSEPQPSGATGVGRRLGQAIRTNDLAPAGSGSAVTGAAINRTIACDSGSIVISGNVNDSTGAGTASVDYVDCRTGADTINGPAALQIRGYDQARGIVTDGTLNFTRVRLSGPGMNWDVSGRVSTQVSTSSATETFTLEDVTIQDNNSSRMMWARDLRFINRFDTVTPPSSFFNQSISGQVYDSVAGFVNISTQFAPHTDPWGPLYYSTRNQSFPDWGIITLTGATGAVRITSLGMDLAKVEVDTGTGFPVGGGARLRWADLGGPLGADLADSDGDGMHNSYETVKGISDPNADNDGDGYTNLTEYLQGSDAGTSGSVPVAVRHIWVTDNSDLAVDTNGQIQVFLGGTSGVLLNPATDELGADFSGGVPSGAGLTTTPDAQGRVFTLAATADPRVWTLSSSAGTSIAITNVAGTNPTSLIRYGDRGLAFRTRGVNTPGYIYLVESRELIP